MRSHAAGEQLAGSGGRTKHVVGDGRKKWGSGEEEDGGKRVTEIE